MEQSSVSFWNWSWVLPTVGGIVLTTMAGIAAYYLRRWFRRRGRVYILIGDREPCEYVTRGSWEPDGKTVNLSPPRFMNFRIPLTFENTRDVALAIRVKNVWFCDHYPEIRGNEWKLPGSSLQPSGLRVENAAREITDPITVPAGGIAHIRLVGTATSAVCHGDPFLSWNYVFVDWRSMPVKVPPLIQRVGQGGDGRSFDANIEPEYPLPEHYRRLQGANLE